MPTPTDDTTGLPQPGELIDSGKYRIERLVGQGGMGVVQAALHTELQTPVAIKWLAPSLAADPAAVERFVREAKLAARIRHPNVVRLLDVHPGPGRPHIVMELLEGRSLAAYAGQRKVPLEEAAAVLLPVLRAMESAHESGVIHRDLKLENVFIANTPGGGCVPKVVDFGIAKATTGGATLATLTQTHALLGTVMYMSPEQIKRSSEVSEQTDVYALGVITYRLLAGTFPYEADNILDLAMRMQAQGPTPLRSHRPDLPEPLEAAVMRAIAPSVAERFANVASYRKALRPWFGDEPSVRLRPGEPRPQTSSGVPGVAVQAGRGGDSTLRPREVAGELPPQRASRLPWLFGALALALGAVAVGLWLREADGSVEIVSESATVGVAPPGVPSHSADPAADPLPPVGKPEEPAEATPAPPKAPAGAPEQRPKKRGGESTEIHIAAPRVVGQIAPNVADAFLRRARAGLAHCQREQPHDVRIQLLLGLEGRIAIAQPDPTQPHGDTDVARCVANHFKSSGKLDTTDTGIVFVRVTLPARPADE